MAPPEDNSALAEPLLTASTDEEPRVIPKGEGTAEGADAFGVAAALTVSTALWS